MMQLAIVKLFPRLCRLCAFPPTATRHFSIKLLLLIPDGSIPETNMEKRSPLEITRHYLRKLLRIWQSLWMKINALIDAVKKLYPSKRIKGIFQPHLFSRTKDFFDGFVRELSKFDELILMPIYPAREKPLEGVTSDILLEKITLGDKRLLNADEIINQVTCSPDEVLITIGAGDIDRIVEPLKLKLLGEVVD